MMTKAAKPQPAPRRPAPAAFKAMPFRKPVYVGDVVSVFCSTVRLGRTSITVHVAAWVRRRNEKNSILVTDGNYTYVAIDDHGHPQPIRQEPPAVSA